MPEKKLIRNSSLSGLTTKAERAKRGKEGFRNAFLNTGKGGKTREKVSL